MAAVRVAGMTPTARNRWGNSKVLSSLQTASPLLRTPGAHITVSVNNDEEERKQRRLESHLRSVMSPSYTSSNVGGGTIRVLGGETASSSLSNTQIAEHYANCIKLSSENKINARNAFGLHLIDYMLEMLQKRGELSNFQVAGCTLDASAKIYASRVDSIYSDAYKVLGGLGRSNAQEEYIGVTSTEKQSSKASRKESAVATIERQPKALDLVCMDLDFGVDPLFKRMSVVFDEGGDEGLLLHQLETCDSYSLVLDGNEAVVFEDVKVKSVYLNNELQGPKMNEVDSLQICPTFSTFTFSDDQSMGEFCSPEDYSGSVSELGCPHLQPDYSMLPCPTVPVDSESNDGLSVLEAEENISCVAYEGDVNEETDDSVALGSCGDGEVAYMFPNITQPVRCPPNGVQPSWMGNLCLTDALEPSEYSYFNASIVTTWAGPQHWKLSSLKKQKGGNKPEVVLRQRKQPFKVDFGQMPHKKLFMKSKACTRLNAQSENMALPHDLCIELDMLFRLFCQPKWILQRRRAVVQMEDQLEGTWYNYANPNDSVHYCPTSMQEEEPDESYDIRTHDGGDTIDMLASGSSQTMGDCEEGKEQFELVAQPRKVEKVSIDYARNAKKINAKKLKTKMWELITSESGGNEEKKCAVNFSTLCIQLPQHVQFPTIHDVSIPICFVFLLHLANDKGLNMIGRKDLCDFVIEH